MRGWLLAAAVAGLALSAAGADLDDAMQALDRGDFAAARVLLEPLASEGSAQARYRLAFLFMNGLGGDADAARGVLLYHEAATGGHGEAQLALALCFAQGRGAVQDSAMALNWCLRAQASGTAGARELCEQLQHGLALEQVAKARQLAALALTEVPRPVLPPRPAAPQARPVATPVPAATPAEAQPPPSRITDIRALPPTNGATVVEVEANGVFEAGGFRRHTISGSDPREVIRLRGIEAPYRQYSIPIGDGNVKQLRVGHHPEHDPPELHLVFDLTSTDVAMRGIERRGTVLRLVLGPEGTTITPPATPTAAPTVVPTVVPTAAPTAVPTARPTATPTARPRPTATATPTARPSPAPTPPPTPTAAPTARPTPAAAPQAPPLPTAEAAAPESFTTNTLYRVADQDPDAGTAAAAGLQRRVASWIQEIVVSQGDRGTTLLRISADAPFGQQETFHHRHADDPATYVLSFPNIRPPVTFEQPLRVGDELLGSVDMVPAPRQGSGGRGLRLLLRLADSNVVVSRVAHRGPHLVVELRRSGLPATPRPEPASNQRPTPATPMPQPTAAPTAPESPPAEPEPSGQQPDQGPALNSVATELLGIEVAPQDDGTTVLRLRADGPVPRIRYRYIRVSDDPPRDVVSVLGVQMPDDPGTIMVGDACLESIKVVHRRMQRPQAVHVVLNLTTRLVYAAEIRSEGQYILIHLQPAR